MDTSADGAGTADDDSIEAIAAAWLAAEQELSAGSGNPGQSEINARALSDRYDEVIRAASREDLRLAWEAARKVAGRAGDGFRGMGQCPSRLGAAARRVPGRRAGARRPGRIPPAMSRDLTRAIMAARDQAGLGPGTGRE